MSRLDDIERRVSLIEAEIAPIFNPYPEGSSQARNYESLLRQKKRTFIELEYARSHSKRKTNESSK